MYGESQLPDVNNMRRVATPCWHCPFYEYKYICYCKSVTHLSAGSPAKTAVIAAPPTVLDTITLGKIAE